MSSLNEKPIVPTLPVAGLLSTRASIQASIQASTRASTRAVTRSAARSSALLTTVFATVFAALFATLFAAPPAGAAESHAVPAKRAAAQATVPAPAPATARPTPALIDPLEQLRLRLAERLSGGKVAAETAASNDMRLVARLPAAALAPAALAAKSAAAKPAARKTTDLQSLSHSTAHADWTYGGAGGPAALGGVCGNGQRQSPIDIRGGLSVDLEPVQFVYQGSRFGVIDNGHTVQVNMAAGNYIAIGGKRFELQQFHFHRPSEERIDGRQFEMSVHLVHKDDRGRLAVVTVLLDKGQAVAQPVVQKVWNNLPLERGEEAAARAPLDLNELLPADRRYFTYMGSLTTPPCSEGVQWIVMRHPVTVTVEQIELFARIYPMNSRPLQAASGRRILQSN